MLTVLAVIFRGIRNRVTHQILHSRPPFLTQTNGPATLLFFKNWRFVLHVALHCAITILETNEFSELLPGSADDDLHELGLVKRIIITCLSLSDQSDEYDKVLCCRLGARQLMAVTNSRLMNTRLTQNKSSASKRIYSFACLIHWFLFALVISRWKSRHTPSPIQFHPHWSSSHSQATATRSECSDRSVPR